MSATAARRNGERSVAMAICPTARMKAPAVKPTRIAPVSPAPLRWATKPAATAAKNGRAWTASVNVALQKMWRTRDKRFYGVQKPAPYATYLRVDDRCPPSSVEDRSCTTNYLSGQPLLLDIERDPMRSLASAS